MEKISNRLISYMCEQNIINRNDYEIYRYGLQSVLEVVIATAANMMISKTIGCLKELICFLIIFIPIRAYAGGFHMQKYGHCFFCSTIVVNSFLLISKQIRFTRFTDLILIIVFGIVIVAIGPVENYNRKLDENERKAFRHKLSYIVLECVFLSVLFYFAHIIVFLSMMQLTFLFVIVTMILGKVMNYRNSKL